MSQDTEPLVFLGLTQLEAEIYRFLLRESPATGYRIAQGLGKPTANVYKALDSLLAKSALIVIEGESRRFRPVPADDFLDGLAHQFERNVDRSRQTLRQLPGPIEDDGIYHLRAREAVLARARRMLEAARASVWIDAFPAPIDHLSDAIRGCVARDVRVAAKVYAPTTIDGVHLSIPPDYEDVRRRWPVQWLNLVVDAEELLIAVFDRQGQDLVEAVWTRNVWITFLLEGTLANEIAFTDVRSAQRSGGDLQASIRQGESLLREQPPGLHRLRGLLGLAQDPHDPTNPTEGSR